MEHFGFLHRAHGAAFGAPRGLLAVMALTVIVEVLWRLHPPKRGYDAAGAAATLGVAAGNLIFGALTSLALGATFSLAYTLAPVHWPLKDWRTWAVGFVLVEFAYYWFHRLSHEVRWLWASHAVHHTPEEMTFLSAIRLGWTNLLSGGWIVYLPLVLMGFSPFVVLSLLAFDLRYQFFLHTEAVGKVGPLEWVLNTPSHHRRPPRLQSRLSRPQLWRGGDRVRPPIRHLRQGKERRSGALRSGPPTRYEKSYYACAKRMASFAGRHAPRPGLRRGGEGCGRPTVTR